MDEFAQSDLEEALRFIASMIGKTEKAKAKFRQETSQHTLQKNRLQALQIASALVEKALARSDAGDCYTEEERKKAVAPIASLIGKSEKARTKLAQGTWQHTMLGNHLKALHIATSLLTKAMSQNG